MGAIATVGARFLCRATRRALLVTAACLMGCTAGAPPPTTLSLGVLTPGDPPPAGTLAGTVHRLSGERFEPAAGAQVAIAGETPVFADAGGQFSFKDLSPGTFELEAAFAGHLAAPLRVRLPAAMGVARLSLVLVPLATGQADRTLAGVVADPRGAALPGATLHVVDSASSAGLGGNRTVQADEAGRFRVLLPAVGVSALTAGVAYLTATGVTPGGIRVETSRVTAVSLDERGAVPLALVAEAFRAPGEPTAIGTDRVRAAGLPTRRDELALRWRGGGGDVEVPAAAIADGEVRVALPPGCCQGEGRLALLVLGIADDASAPTLPWPPRAP